MSRPSVGAGAPVAEKPAPATSGGAPSGDGRGKSMNRRMRFVATILTFGGLLFGYDTGVVNGALPSMAEDFQMSQQYEGFITSALQFGAIFGAVFGGRLSDRYGRHRVMVTVAILFTLGSLGSVLSPEWWVLALCRVVLGLAVGGASVTIPVYLAELAPSHLRGRVVSQNEFMVVFGQFLAFAFNAGITGVMDAEHANTWRWMLSVCLLPAILLWAGLTVVPESPRWLARWGRVDAMLKVLREIREQAYSKREGEEVERLAAQDEKASQGTLSELLSVRWMRRILYIGVGMAVINQISGINVVQYYGVSILTDAGFAGNAAFVVNLLIGLAGVVGVGIALGIIQRVRRKTMLTVGLVATILTLGLLASTAVFVADENPLKKWVILGSIVVFVGFMQCCIGTMTWLFMSEIYPLKVRGVAMGISTGVQWTMNFLVALLFPMLSAALGLGATIGIFVVLQVLALIWVRVKVPETKDKTLEEIEDAFKEPDAARA